MSGSIILNRRSVLVGGGALIVSFSLGDAFAQDQSAPAAPKPPGSLAQAPYLDSWIRIDADGGITAFTGKAELGQGFQDRVPANRRGRARRSLQIRHRRHIRYAPHRQ